MVVVLRADGAAGLQDHVNNMMESNASPVIFFKGGFPVLMIMIIRRHFEEVTAVLVDSSTPLYFLSCQHVASTALHSLVLYCMWFAERATAVPTSSQFQGTSG